LLKQLEKLRDEQAVEVWSKGGNSQEQADCIVGS